MIIGNTRDALARCEPGGMNDLLLAPTPPQLVRNRGAASGRTAARSRQLRKESGLDRAGADVSPIRKTHVACTALARLAREELRHFEQVDRLRRDAGPAVPAAAAESLCAKALRRLLRSRRARAAPGPVVARRLYRGALLRTVRRFVAGPAGASGGAVRQLDGSRKHGTRASLSAIRRRACAGRQRRGTLEQRIAVWRSEAELVTAPDAQFRFHSGPPVCSC